ncbi:MAG: MaoC family dehydratase [Parvibaculaceae bacterium]
MAETSPHRLAPDRMVGIAATFSKTVAESDIYLLAGVLGEFDPLHVDEEYCKTTPYGRRIAQGALIVGFMMSAAALAAAKVDAVLPSLGLDRVRHTGPVFIGDTVRVTYVIERFDEERARGYANVVATNQKGETVAVATHLFKVLEATPA